jgi:oxygen-independent coproporphyrinogen-3 oxidase
VSERDGLYVHIPFCSAICPYCDFSVLVGRRERRKQFVATLAAEIELYSGYPGSFDTIYFGGGTPSILEAEDLAGILETLRQHLEIDPSVWISLEANPEDVTASALSDWCALGVRTVSLGVQSFNAAALAYLGRRHSAEESRRSVEHAKASGLHTVSVDLIFGLPEQKLEGWRRDLDAAVALEPDHVSCYQLTVHDKTLFGFRRSRGELTELGEEEQAEMFFATHERLAAAGYEAYEVSNFARDPAHQSVHNRKYWNHVPYLGLGPSAHSFDGRRRWWNLAKLGPWEKKVARGERPVAETENLGPKELALERLMLGLRTPAGLDLGLLREACGVDLLESNAETIGRLSEGGFLDSEGERLVPTLPGLAVADTLARAFEI